MHQIYNTVHVLCNIVHSLCNVVHFVTGYRSLYNESTLGADDITLVNNADNDEESEVDVPSEIPHYEQRQCDIKKECVESPILMPPPTAIPQIKPHPPWKFFPSCVNSQYAPKFKPYKKGITNKVTKEQVHTNKQSFQCEEKAHISVPCKEIQCFVTNNNTDMDSYTKNLVCYEISKKIYAKPEKRVNMRVMPTKTDDSATPNPNPVIHAKKFKVNRKHFKEKNMMVDDINFDYLEHPMRSSTPTPSVSESTILAGNLDLTMLDDLEETEVNSTVMQKNEDTDDDDDDHDDRFEQSLRKAKAKPFTGNAPNGKNDKYCKDWMQKCEGVCTNNYEPPPSLYAPSVALSTSLMDITSVQFPPIVPRIETNQKKHEHVGGIANIKDFRNTKFM